MRILDWVLWWALPDIHRGASQAVLPLLAEVIDERNERGGIADSWQSALGMRTAGGAKPKSFAEVERRQRPSGW